MRKALRIKVAVLFAMMLAACACCIGCSGSNVLQDGTYDIEVETDSSMFHTDLCQLSVADGKMTASMTMPGTGFSRLFFGTVEEAEKAADADIYDYRLDDKGKYVFDIPVEKLDVEYQIAAWGQRRDRWYQHTILFHAPDAQASGSSASGQLSASSAQPGKYTVAVELKGGTGRADVESPAKLVKNDDGTMTLTVVWSSPNYDQMVVDGTQYLPLNSGGNSTFEIPVSSLSEDLAVRAETTAMSQPHMIDYVIHFDESSLQAG